MHTDGAPDNLQMLAMHWATSAEYGLPEHTDSHMLGDGDARYMAEIMGETSEDDIKRRARTSGMIVSSTRGEGEVFTVGACEWDASCAPAEKASRVTPRAVNLVANWQRLCPLCSTISRSRKWRLRFRCA